jgi:hypothetical protein
MNCEKAKALYLQCTLYKTLAWAAIIWIPASKLSECSPNSSLKWTLAAMITDFNAIILACMSLIIFILAKSAEKKANELLKVD